MGSLEEDGFGCAVDGATRDLRPELRVGTCFVESALLGEVGIVAADLREAKFLIRGTCCVGFLVPSADLGRVWLLVVTGMAGSLCIRMWSRKSQTSDVLGQRWDGASWNDCCLLIYYLPAAPLTGLSVLRPLSC